MRKHILRGRGLVFSTFLALAIVCPAARAQYTWTERTAPGSRLWYGMASSSDGTKLAAAPSDGYIYTSTDSGATWTQQTSSGSQSWSNIASSSDGTKLVATIYSGYLHTSSDSGATWTQRTAPGSRQWVGIACSDDGTKWAACYRGGYIYTSSDSGATWTAQSGSGSRDWRNVASSSDGTKLAATVYTGTGNGYIYTSTDSGVTWTERTGAGLRNWQGITSSSDGTKLVAGGAYDAGGSYIYTSTDSGATWTERTGAGLQSWFDMACTPDGTTILAGSSEYMYISTDSGATWTAQTAPGSHTWMRVASSSDATKLAACVYSGYIYTGVIPAAAPTVTTAAVSDVTTTAATSGGNVTDDGGADVTARGVCWSTSANPTVADDYTEDGSGTGEFTSDITGLSPGMTYHVRAYATNSAGTAYGSDVEFTAGIAVTTSGGSAAYVIGVDDVVVDPAIEIAAGDVTDFKVSITGNFSSGDVLDYTGTLPGGVSASYAGETGILSFSGTASAADWQELVRTVTFGSSSASRSTRTIAFTAGGAIPFDGTGHFYEYAASAEINWTDARDAAAASTLFGLQGYLATITSQEENDFIRAKLGADAWIGGSDEAEEDVWKWVTGPESGTQFSDGSTPVGEQFANWNTGEPNNSGGTEHYAEIYSTDGVGKWNDLPDDPILDGYVAEYGGMPSDPSVQITDTRDVTVTALPTVTTTAISNITATTADSGGNVTDDGGDTVTARGVCWSTSENPTIADDKTEDGSGTGVFTSSITGLNASTTYHVRAYATSNSGTAYGSDVNFTTDPPTVQFTAATQSGAEDVGSMTVTAQLSAVSGQNVTVPYTLTGTAADPADYTITASPVTITAGDTTADITITVVDDALNELAETVIVTMGAPTNATKGVTDEHTATITDNDDQPTVQFTAATQSGAENVGTMTVTAQLSAASGQNVTVPYTVTGTAADPADYSITATPVTITAGDTSADITITVVNDTLDELDETVIVTMGTPTNATKGATDEHTATITDNDAPLTVTTTAVSNITDTTAESGGNVTADGGEDVTTRGVCWSTSENPTTADDYTEDGSGTGEFTSSITGLEPETTYYVAAYATNSEGTAYGDDVVFTTDAAPASTTVPTVTTADVSDITTTAATCGGNVTDDGGADVTARGVCWSTSENPTTADDYTEGGSGTGEFTSNITGLDLDTTYHVRAYATNSVGTAYGADVTFATVAEESEPEPEPEPELAPDLRVTIEAQADADALVGDDVAFTATVENVGTATATDVVLTVPIPDNAEFVSARLVTDPSAQAADPVVTVGDEYVTLEFGDVPAGDSLQVEIVFRVTAAGEVTVDASATSEEVTTPKAAETAATIDAEDEYLTIVETTTPVYLCGALGLAPLFVLFGLIGTKLRRRRRGR